MEGLKITTRARARQFKLRRTGLLVTHGRADALKFDCHPMNDLVKELRNTFSVRYEAPSSKL